MLRLLRQFIVPFNGWPWPSYLGLALLLLALGIGFFSARGAFGAAVASYVFLLALPFAIAPKVWRGLISSRQLMLTPGFARAATAAAFLFTVLQSLYLNVFSELYGLPGSHLRQTALMFINATVYMAIMQYAITTSWAIAALSLMPVMYMASLLFVLTGGAMRNVLGNDHVAWLAIACALGWLLAWWHVGRHHQFRNQHSSVTEIRDLQNPRVPVALWLLGDSEARGSASVSLLLGYPVNLGSRLRVMIYTVFFGPLVATVFLTLLHFGRDWEWSFHPNMFEILLGCSLYPATFYAFQQVDWVARLRLLWLRGALQRTQMWSLLENQILISTALMLTISSMLAACGLLFSQLSLQWLVHFPLLVLSFNTFYTYYMLCVRIKNNWTYAYGLLITFGCSALIYFAWFFALNFNSPLWLYGLELVALAFTVYLRPIARRRLESIDWLKVKPSRLAKLAN